MGSLCSKLCSRSSAHKGGHVLGSGPQENLPQNPPKPAAAAARAAEERAKVKFYQSWKAHSEIFSQAAAAKQGKLGQKLKAKPTPSKGDTPVVGQYQSSIMNPMG